MKVLVPFLTLSLGFSVLVSKDSFHSKETMSPLLTVKRRLKSVLSDNNRDNWALAEIDSTNAWTISRGSKNVIVAIIDTGADIHHPDLEANIWNNPGEIPGNGIDDDKNGFVDDVHGWNFAGGDNNVADNHGHGTHIAGIIGGKNQNGQGINGVAPEVSLMILKYYDPSSPGSDSVGREVAAIKYAVKMGASVINFSAGGLAESDEEEEAIRLANAAGILVVAAAGNEKANSDLQSFYPADYALPNILSVTAIDSTRKVLASSNYGIRTVDLAAPGRDIESTLPGGKYGKMSGTSQATAFASGVAALLIASRQEVMTPEQIISQLVKTGIREPQLNGKTRARTRLNSYRALVLFDGTASNVPKNGI